MYLPVLNIESAAYPLNPPGISSLGNLDLGAITTQMPSYSDYMVDDNGQVIFFGENGDIVASTMPDGSVEITATGQIVPSDVVPGVTPKTKTKTGGATTAIVLLAAGAGALFLFARR